MARVSRLKVLPDRVFHSLWDRAAGTELVDYIRAFTAPLSEEYIDFYKKYKIGPADAAQMLKEIHARANMSLKEIVSEAGIKKSEIYHVFCIPKRTVDDWYAGVNRCPSYVRLMLLRQFHLLRLGKYIILASQKDYRESAPGVYKHRSEAKRVRLAALTSDVKIKNDDSAIRHSESIRELLNKTAYLSEIMRERNGHEEN